MKTKTNKYVLICKRQKKEQLALAKSQRGSWNGVNPVTRSVESKKTYNRASVNDANRKYIHSEGDF